MCCSDALKAMESVAEHINEMQKIYEEFGSIFDELTKTYVNKHNIHGADKKRLELNVGDLQVIISVFWPKCSCNQDYTASSTGIL